MNFTDVFIKRPVFATVLSLIVILVGAVSLMTLQIRQYPLIENSVIQVAITYPGASAQLMEGFVTTPIEQELAGVDGVDYMTSSSTENLSTITVNLKIGYDINKAMTDVSSKVSSVRWKLPKQIQDPVVKKNDSNSYPIVFIAFTSEHDTPEAITDYLLRVVQPQLQTISGVAQAMILGERQYAMRIVLDSSLMTAHGVTPGDVYDALAMNNVQSAAGRIEGHYQEFNVTAGTDLTTEEEFNNLVIKSSHNQLIRIRDIGYAKLGSSSYRSSAVMDGKPTVVIGMQPLSTANPLTIADDVNTMLPQIEEKLPDGMKAKVTYSSADFINESIDEVYKTFFEAIIFVIIVIFFFLGSFRPVSISAITIPLSIIGVCGFMSVFNFTINTLTLLAWVLAIGLVVDDAIVVTENVHRHMEEGLSPFFAAIKGTREIQFAIIVMTLTLAAVYAPIGFTPGLTGILFREFAFTLAFAVIISGFIALTLSPMMCSKILKLSDSPDALPHKIDHYFDKFKNKYKNLLISIVTKPKLMIGVVALLYMICLFLFAHTKEELAPIEDQGVLFAYGTAPSAANINYVEKYTKQLEPIFTKLPETKAYIDINGWPSSNNSLSVLSLIGWGERKRDSTQIQKAVYPSIAAITGMIINPFPPPPLPGSGIVPLQFDIKTTSGTYEQLNDAMNTLIKAAHQYPGFLTINTDIKLDQPQFNLKIDRSKAGILGISMKEISKTLYTMMAEPNDIQFDLRGRGYYVIPQFKGNFDFVSNPQVMNNFYVRSKTNELIPLSNLVQIETTVDPQSLNHFQQLRSAELQATVTPGYTIGQDIDYLVKAANELLPNNIEVDYAGQARQFIQSAGAMEQAMIFAVMFIFLILAAQFESFRDPLTIMIVVPLTMTGAILGLWFLGANGSLSVYSKIGLLTLIGLISKHGILIVEFANQLQEEGRGVFDAIVESASIRLRPILMTTAAMVFGAIPLELATGAGSVSRQQIGTVIVWGMVSGTFFSLFVVPTMYLIMAKLRFKVLTLGGLAGFIALTVIKLISSGSGAFTAEAIMSDVLLGLLIGVAIAIGEAAFSNREFEGRPSAIEIDEADLLAKSQMKPSH